jgi:hypothetical protein
VIGQTFVGIVLLGAATAIAGPAAAQASPVHRVTVVWASAGAPSAMSVSDLTFSERIDKDGRPDDPSVEFDKGTDRIWVSVTYRGYSGEQLSFIARANGEDWKFGDLDCCEGGSSGRFAFPLERDSGTSFGGAAYEVRIYAGDAEVAAGGFGVKGTGAFDNDNED